MPKTGVKFSFVGTFTGSQSSLRTFHSEFTKTSVRPSKEVSASCTASFRSRLIRSRVTATGAERSHGPRSISMQTSQPRQRWRRASLVGLIFFLVTYFWSIVLFLPMLIAHPFVLLSDRIGRRFHDFIAMAWMKMSFGSVGMRALVRNAELLPADGNPVVYVANHTSFLDVYAFAYLQRRIKYLAKAEIFRLPIVGWAMAMAGNISIKRMTRKGQMDAYRKMLRTVENGVSLVIYPEGTRSPTGKLRRFHRGAFRTAKQQAVPVVPVTILGTREIMPSDALLPLRYPKSPITLVIHKPLDSSKYSVEELRDLSFNAIDSALPQEIQTRHNQSIE